MSHRIQFDLSEEEWDRLSKYIILKQRHFTGKDALMEWCNRKEGRDNRVKEENLIKDAKRLQELIDSGRIKL